MVAFGLTSCRAESQAELKRGDSATGAATFRGREAPVEQPAGADVAGARRMLYSV